MDNHYSHLLHKNPGEENNGNEYNNSTTTETKDFSPIEHREADTLFTGYSS